MLDFNMPYLPLLIGAATSLLMVPASIWIARRCGLMDRPDARKVHREPTPRLGGIAIVSGLFIGVLVTLVVRHFQSDPVSPEVLRSLLAIGGAGFFVFLVGLVDDLRTVSSRFKLIALIGASATVCGSGVVLGQLFFGGDVTLRFQWLSWLVTIVWIIGISVAINFIDGLDGLAGGLTLFAAVILGLFAVAGGHVDQAILPLALSGGLIGFLFYNWYPAKTFMGDCGSMTIGFVLAASIVSANPVVGTMRGLVLPALALCIPIADAGLTVFRRRYLQRRSMFSAERGHIHHRMLDRGLSHPQVVLTIHLISALAVGIGLIALSFEGLATLGGFTLLLPLVWGTFQLAGSMRTNEMIDALKHKRDLDRTAKGYRSTFEDMQLEFHHVVNFSQWWEGVCRTAERLDFVQVKLRLPANSDRERDMTWENPSESLALREQLHAALPVKLSTHDEATATISVQIASTRTLESAGERLALFARLMTEYSLAAVRQKERESKQSKKFKATAAVGDWPSGSDRLSPVNNGPFAHLRVAIVHDFLYTYCGAERVLEQMLDVFPHADLFALFDFLPENQRGFLRGRSVTTTFLQKLPFARTKHRAYLPLMPFAVEQLDVSGYDVVISSSYLAAKGVITGPDQLHVSYCHSPIRYAWDLHHQYLDQAGLGFGPKGLLARAILHYIRSWDVRSSMGVDHFIANSRFVARRIKKVYRRNATVIHPPVDTERFEVNPDERDDFYLVAGRMVPYKRTDLIVSAFRDMPDRKLVVIGEGPDFEKVKELAGDNVTLLGFQDAATLVDHMQRAKALIFVAEEDFGIVPVEALACGTPVIAFGKGGVTESVLDGQHGVLFDEQSPESLIAAIERFENQQDFGTYTPQACRDRADQFSSEHFRTAISEAVKSWTQQKWPERRQGLGVAEAAQAPEQQLIRK